MRLSVDRTACCGAGNCVLLAPEVFDQGEDDGVVVLLTDSPAPRHEAAAREAAAVCPASAITVREETSRDA
ncbi:MAG TPA: ferredoxin [Streptomyces sp.]